MKGMSAGLCTVPQRLSRWWWINVDYHWGKEWEGDHKYIMVQQPWGLRGFASFTAWQILVARSNTQICLHPLEKVEAAQIVCHTLPYLVVFLAFNLLRIRDVVRVCQLNIISDVERNAVLHGQWLVTSGNTRGAEVPEVSAPAPQAACHGGELPVNEGRPMCQKGYGAAASRRSRGGGVAMFIREFTGHISHRSAFRQHWQIAASSQVEKAAPVV